jgi:hypothetical protein
MPAKKTKKKPSTKCKKCNPDSAIEYTFSKVASVLIITVAVVGAFTFGAQFGDVSASLEYGERLTAQVTNWDHLQNRKAAFYKRVQRQNYEYKTNAAAHQMELVEKILAILEAEVELPPELAERLRMIAVAFTPQLDAEKEKMEETEMTEEEKKKLEMEKAAALSASNTAAMTGTGITDDPYSNPDNKDQIQDFAAPAEDAL